MVVAQELGWKYREHELLTWEQELEDAVFSWNNYEPAVALVFFRSKHGLVVQWSREEGMDLGNPTLSTTYILSLRPKALPWA